MKFVASKWAESFIFPSQEPSNQISITFRLTYKSVTFSLWWRHFSLCKYRRRPRGRDVLILHLSSKSTVLYFTPVELIVETSGVPFSSASRFSSPASCLSVAFPATTISAHPEVMGSSFRGGRDWDCFKLLIFVPHKGAGWAGLALQTITEPVSTARVKLCSPTHTRTHADGWPSIPENKCERTETFYCHFTRKRGSVGSHLCTQLHFLWAASDPPTALRTIQTAAAGNSLHSVFMCFRVNASCCINQKAQEWSSTALDLEQTLLC